MKNQDLSKCPSLTFCNFMFGRQNLIRFNHQLIVRSIVPPTWLAHHPATHIQTRKASKATKIHTHAQTNDTWAIFFKFAQTSSPGSSRFLIGTLQKYDGDGKGKVHKANQQRCTCITFFWTLLYLKSLHNYDVKWRNFKLTWERERRSDM